MTLKRTAIVCATLAWAAWSGGGPAAAQQVGPPLAQPANEPGRPTLAKVWVMNRERAEAIPVTVQGVTASEVLRVTWTGTPSVSLSEASTVPMRVVRQNWEYRQVTIRATEDPTSALNAAGAEGWEALGPAVLLQSGDVRFVLKRPR